MKFGPVPIEEAEGTILAHSEEMRGEGRRTRKISKGTQLTADHLADLKAAGLREVVVAALEPEDVHEDAAAFRLAQALLAPEPGLSISDASTGRVNLRAERAGVVEVDSAAIHAVNRVDPGITVATVPEWYKLAARGLAATIKIIPYAVPGAALDRACELAVAALRLHPPHLTTATLIETQVGQGRMSDKGRRAMAARLDHFDVALSDRVIVPHETDALQAALEKATGELLLILTGSATSDLRDTAPEAVRHAGGEVIHYGMPVDPGNLLFLGQIGARPVIGLPGCARSPALNGADWVLERVVCGVEVTSDDIAGMGVGGLLKEIPTRPSPRRRVDRSTDAA
jgi:molybdenum cofactor cytidylyltransferase